MSYFKISLVTLVLGTLVLSGCGGGGSTPETTSTVSAFYVPRTVSITIPQALKNSRTSGQQSKNIARLSPVEPTVKTESYGYKQLKESITIAEEMIDDVKKNLKDYLNPMMPSIIAECEGTAINTQCDIPEGVISLSVEGQTLVMGAIEYTKQDSSHTYQERVKIDLKPALQSIGETGILVQSELVKWSSDDNHVETLSEYQNATDKFSTQLRYDKNSTTGASKMYLSHTFETALDKGVFQLKIEDKNTADGTVAISSSGVFGTDTFSSEGVVSDSGGYLLSRGEFASNKFAEKETFDANGNLKKSSFCDPSFIHNSKSCDLNDESTWLNFDAIDGIVESFGENEFAVPSHDFIELSVRDGSIEGKFCLLLPPSFDTNSMTMDSIFEHTIGDIAVFEDKGFGTLLDSGYKDQLNTVKVVCSTIESATFTVLPAADRPTISVYIDDGDGQ